MKYICNYCKNIFEASHGKIPCPNCGHKKPCEGHRMVTPGEEKYFKEKFPSLFNKKTGEKGVSA